MSEENRVPKTLNESGYEQQLNRTLNLRELVFYGFAFMSPIAPAAVYGYVFPDAQGMIALVYFVGVVAIFFTALSYARMSSRFPIAGSVYSYVQRGINPHIGFIAGGLIMIDYFIVPALVCNFTGIWVADLVPSVPFWVWILASIIFITVVNIFGIKMTSSVNLILVGIQLVLFIIFIAIGIPYVLSHGGFTLDPFYQAGKIDLAFIASATALAVLSFLGFDAISTLGEEAKDATKNIGRATLICLILLGLMFIMQTWIAACAVPSFDHAGYNPDMAFFDTCGVVGGAWLRTSMVLALVVANTACGLVGQASVSRIIFSLSRDKMIPSVFGKIHEKYKTPFFTIVLCGVITAFIAIFVNTEGIARLVNFGALSAFFMLNFTVFWFFYIKEKNRGAYGIFNYIILPFLGMFIIGFVWSGLDAMTKIIGLSWLAIVVIYGAVQSKGYKVVPEAFRKVEL